MLACAKNSKRLASRKVSFASRKSGKMFFARSAQIYFFIIALSILIVAWVWPLPHIASDLFTAHMVQHLLTMNVAALLISLAIKPNHRLFLIPLSTVTTIQMAAFWFWHTPAVFSASHHHFLWSPLMKVSLFGVALLFWTVVLDLRANSPWSRIFALLITAKVFCLLGAVFVFTRRPLYATHDKSETWGITAIEDQQLAGLVMVSACALVYVAAAITMFTNWLYARKIAPHKFPHGFADENPRV
jgi:putative membrane protein